MKEEVRKSVRKQISIIEAAEPVNEWKRKPGSVDKKEIRSRKNQKLYRSRFGKGGKIMKKLEIVIRPESLENLELLLEEQKRKRYDDHKYPWIWKPEGISSDVPWSGNRG